MNETIVFEEKGYPIIKVYDDYFEIKAIDYWEFRKFDFSNLKNIELYIHSKNVSPLTLSTISFFKHFFEVNEPNKLIITLKNNGTWEYLASNKINAEFTKIIKIIESKLINY